MKKAYLETSVINRAQILGLSGQNIRNNLEKIGLMPVIGTHTIYEIGRTFLDKSQKQKGQDLFTIIKDLKPSFVPTTRDLLNQEVLKFRTNSVVLPFFDYLNYISTKIELNKLANGNFDQNAENFIRKREQEIRKGDSIFMGSYLQHVRNVKKNNPSLFKKLKTYNDIIAHFSDKFPVYIIGILRGSVTRHEAILLSRNLDSFPTLQSVMRANLYFQFIMITEKKLPSSDKIDDYRHIIDASYSELFITEDTQLGRTVKKINPDLINKYLKIFFRMLKKIKNKPEISV